MMIEDREAFLRAIFAAPDDDVPRLVYADYLEENGQPHHAALIRVQCRLARRPPDQPVDPADYREQAEHIKAVIHDDLVPATDAFPNRGFRTCEEITLDVNHLSDPDDLRRQSVTTRPEWFGATKLRFQGGRITGGGPFELVAAVPAFENVMELDLTGEIAIRLGQAFPPTDFDYQPVVSVPGLEALLRHPLCRRLKVLKLDNNDLDNDALRYLAKAPNLIRLERLDLSNGNRFRGRVWQQVLERFGEDVVR